MTTFNKLIALIRALCNAFRCRLSCLCGNKKSEHARNQHKPDDKKEPENDPQKNIKK